MNSLGRILLIEDEPGLVMTISDRLLAVGYLCESALDGAAAWRHLGAEPFDLIILDIMLPDTDGFALCQKIRSRNMRMPVLMLTARSAVDDRVRGLQSGADDYLGKPFSMGELLARVEALLRRSRLAALPGTASEEPPPVSATRLTFEGFRLDLESRTLTATTESPPREVGLNATEFRLLAYLANHPNKVLSREEMLDAVWGYNNEVTSRTVDVHIAWLRKKLGELEEPRHILTIRRGGYKFVP